MNNNNLFRKVIILFLSLLIVVFTFIYEAQGVQPAFCTTEDCILNGKDCTCCLEDRNALEDTCAPCGSWHC